MKDLKIGEGTDTVNLTDDQHELFSRAQIEGKSQYGSVPPFYRSLTFMTIFCTILCLILVLHTILWLETSWKS